MIYSCYSPLYFSSMSPAPELNITLAETTSEANGRSLVSSGQCNRNNVNQSVDQDENLHWISSLGGRLVDNESLVYMMITTKYPIIAFFISRGLVHFW